MSMTPFLIITALALTIEVPLPNFKNNNVKSEELFQIQEAKAADILKALPAEYNPIASDACLPSIMTQGSCGSCYAFSSSFSLAHRTCKMSNGSVNFVPGPLELINCETYNQGCNGGDPSYSFRYIADYGLSNWTCNDYNMTAMATINLGSCNFNLCGATPVSDKYYCKQGSAQRFDYMTIGNDNLLSAIIKDEIYNRGAVVSSLIVQDDNSAFSNYRTNDTSNVFTTDATDPNSSTDHAIVIIGWGSNYWIIANSWGNQWGYNGFAKIATGIRKIASDAYFCEPLI